MITNSERKLIVFLVKIKVFNIYTNMRCYNIGYNRGFRWLFKLILNRQEFDNLHHAPACGANHWCKMAIIFQKCSCGAQAHYEEELK